MSSREVLTFQIGNYSNYAGAHWWNIQESYFQYNEKNPSDINHDVLFREGKTLKGSTTFTPRVLVVDSANNLANVPVLNEPLNKSYNLIEEDSKRLIVQEQNVTEKHEFIKDLEKLDRGQRVDINQRDYKFDSTIRVWCDYLRTKYHPKSVCTVQSSLKMDMFYCGLDAYHAVEDDFIEKIRFYIEECDNLQGFQIIVDGTDGFAGFTDSVLLHLLDEYPSKSTFTIPVIPNFYKDSTPFGDIKRAANILLAYQKLSENSSLVVPVGTNISAWRSLGPAIQFPNIVYNAQNSYHTSAIIASFLDTVTLKYRLREEYNSMYDLVSGLNFYNKKICAASISLPFPMTPDSYLLDTLENLDDSVPLWSQITPGCEISEDTILYQRITVRGIPCTKLKNPKIIKQNNRAYTCSSVEELVHMYLSFRLTTISDVTAIKLPLKTVLPYPKIFSSKVTPLGAIDESSTSVGNSEVNSCPVITGIHCCKGVGRMLDSLHQCVKSVDVKRLLQIFGSHIDIDEFNECLERVLAMGYGYASDVEIR